MGNSNSGSGMYLFRQVGPKLLCPPRKLGPKSREVKYLLKNGTDQWGTLIAQATPANSDSGIAWSKLQRNDTYLPTKPVADIPTYLPRYLPSRPSTYQPTYLPTYLPTHSESNYYNVWTNIQQNGRDKARRP